MCPVVRIPDNIFSRLEKHAQGFDTPANVIERLLDAYEDTGDSGDIQHSTPYESPRASAVNGKRDTTKYIFEGKMLGKGRLVVAVVAAYADNHPDTTFHDLLIQFPKHLQGSRGVFSKAEDAKKNSEETGHKRHFIKDNELIRLSDCTVAVSSQWGVGNIDNFVRHAKTLGYEIKEVRS